MSEVMGEQRAIADVAVEPFVAQDRRAAVIAAAVKALSGPELQLWVGPLSTVVAGRLDDIVHAVQRAHRAAAADAPRVVTTLRLETKRGGVDADERNAEAWGMQPSRETTEARPHGEAEMHGPAE